MQESMGQKEIPLPAIIGAIAVLLVLVGFFIFKAATGGTVGEGVPGSIVAAPPMPKGVNGHPPGAP